MAKLTFKPGDLIVLSWDDIREHSEWQDSAHPVGGVFQCESVGWVVKITRKAVVLTRTYGGSGTERVAGDSITFPRGCITGFRVLSSGGSGTVRG